MIGIVRDVLPIYKEGQHPNFLKTRDVNKVAV
jgi:hypothetical protein